MAYTCPDEKRKIREALEMAEKNDHGIVHAQAVYDAAQSRPVSDAFPIANDGEEKPLPLSIAMAEQRKKLSS